MKYEHILSFALEHPWAVTDSMRRVIAGILARHIAGEGDAGEIAAALGNRKDLPQPRKGGAVALIPIYGVIAPRMNLMSDMSGGTTFEALTAQLHDAMANETIKTIVFDVDSPGGNVAGATEFAREVLKARVTKPIIAQAQHLMASAAYWVCACATEIVASPSAMVGSIGVYAMYDDISEALAKLGIKRELIVAGKYKAEGVDGGPLSDDARAHIKALVDDTYIRFIGDVSKGRGITAAAVRGGYGEGRCVGTDEAKALGMIDRIATLDETLARVLTSAPGIAGTAQATDQERLAATSQEPAVSDVLWTNQAQAALLELDL